MEDLPRCHQKNIKLALDEISSSVEMVCKVFSGDEREEYLKQIESNVRDICKMEIRMQSKSAISKDLENLKRLQKGRQSSIKFEEEYTQRMNKILEEFNPENSQTFKNFKKQVDLIINNAGNQEKEAEEDLDESKDLVVTDSSESYVDPITKKTVVDPVRSKVCKHYFSRDVIMEILKSRSQYKKMKCPHIACNSRLGEEDLEDDVELSQKLRAMARMNK